MLDDSSKSSIYPFVVANSYTFRRSNSTFCTFTKTLKKMGEEEESKELLQVAWTSHMILAEIEGAMEIALA